MICPYCKNDEDKVVDSRMSGLSIRRRRECLTCGVVLQRMNMLKQFL
jgi:transcriptional repressor NrdR